MTFSARDRENIATAITEAERNTSGEIVCIVDEQAHQYSGTTLTVAALLAFALPLLAVIFGFNPAQLLPVNEWTDGDQAGVLRRTVEAYAVAQLLIFVAVAALLWWSKLGAALTPRAIKRDRVHAAALSQFRARGLESTHDRTGVLIYACMADRVAEVIADAGIYGKVPPEFWAESIAALLAGIKRGAPADGFVEAVTMAGRALAQHFPPRSDDSDELPNHLIEL
jgi:putative membrane protein